MTVAAVRIVWADEREDETLMEHVVEVPEGVTDADAWAEELHQDFRKVVLGYLEESVDYFGHWVEVAVCGMILV